MNENRFLKVIIVSFFLMLNILIAPGDIHVALAQGEDNEKPIPVLAYYYIWFEERSWDRAKTDFPLLGNYSSDDRAVMVQHVTWAKQAGIDGFIVSWKHTDVLDPRLDMLVEVAAENDFKLVMIYQGLDFERDPLPAARIQEDIEWFVENYGNNPVFDLFGEPVMIWSGTWKFSTDDIELVGKSVRTEVLLLATERNSDGYLRIADLVDGNAYYWSSVNPETNSRYQEKLNGMSADIHEQGGLWIAPAAPGYDARLVGGTTVVDRKNGATFRTQLQVALNSAPDAIGIISWNEFSENTHIEPSQNFNAEYLNILADQDAVVIPVVDTFNSSDPPLVEEEEYLAEVDFRGDLLVTAAGISLALLLIFSAIQRRRQ